MKGGDRNHPCWCGSGRKFKKCHLDRAYQARPTFSELLDDQKSTQIAVCLHPSAPVACDGKIIKAHTIQRAGGLSRIARGGHVYAGRGDLGTLKRTGGVIAFSLVGINNASTFTGFCARHDADLFRAIEVEPFSGSLEQLFLFSYRPFCRELFTKQAVQRSEMKRSTYDRGLPLGAQVAYQRFDLAQANGTALAMRDQLQHKRQHDDLLLAGDYQSVRGLVIEFDRTPAVLVSASLFPDFDFQGGTIQQFATLDRLDVIGFNVVPKDDGGIAVLSWVGDQPACTKLVASLLALSDEDIPDALLRFTFEYFENTFIAPDWWESLAAVDRDALINRLNVGASPLTVRRATCLVDDGRRVATWKVTERRLIQT